MFQNFQWYNIIEAETTILRLMYTASIYLGFEIPKIFNEYNIIEAETTIPRLRYTASLIMHHEPVPALGPTMLF